MKKAIITGGAGFIGSHLVDILIDNGYQVCVIDDFSLGREQNIAAAKNTGKVHIIKESCLETDIIVRKVKNIYGDDFTNTEMWHMAANSDISAGVSNPDIDLQKTFMTTYQSLELCKRLGIKKFAFASTSAIYGYNSDGVSEDTGPFFPVSNYGAMKLASEGIISAATEQGLENVWIFRFPNVVGGRSTHGALYDFAHKLKTDNTTLAVLGDGSQCKPYIHVSELVDAMFYIRTHTNDTLNYYNVGVSGLGTSVKFMAEQTVQQSGYDAKIAYGNGNKGWVGDVPSFSYNTEKLNALGWHCKLTSDEAVIQAVADLKKEILDA